MDFLNHETVHDLRIRLEKALEAFAKENGLKFDLGRGSYTPYNVSFKLELALVTQTGEALTREAENFFHRAPSYGLSPTDLGKTVKCGDKVLKIVGLNARSRNAPITLEDSSGKRYKMSVAMLKAHLNHNSNTSGQPAAPELQALPLESD